MRVSNYAIKNNLLSQIQTNYTKSEKAQNQLNSGKKMQAPSDSPIDSINAIYGRIRDNQIKQYTQNSDNLKGALEIAHTSLESSNQMVHRIRELAVQAANGTYSEADRKNMATEVEQILRQLIAETNAKYKDSYLFSGSNGDLKPFEVAYEKDPNSNMDFVRSVRLQTTKDVKEVNIDQGNVLNVDLSANSLFWSHSNVVISRQDSSNYISDRDQTLSINGRELTVSQGDDLNAVIAQINNTVPGVRAEIQAMPDGTNVFALRSTSPEKIEMLDLKGGSVLQDLGMILGGLQGQDPSNNLHPNTISVNGSSFEAIISFRDALLRNDLDKIGSLHLGAIDEIQDHLLSSQSKISAMVYRLDENQKRLDTEKVSNTNLLSKAEDVDTVEASINFNQLMNIHRISLMTGAKINQTTLMDYLR